ncbi:heme/hemin ABC transporter substrate-binding protein [Methylophaga sp.]|uniref:heme/hemin ABC transporter substrate-binding protein n=1 Tax=Methylophaga sp. TaxID=2024840 RepID=UPI003F70CA2A
MNQSEFSRRSIRKLFYGVLVLFSTQIAIAEPIHAERIISVDSNATEILLALGVGPKIIATDITSEPLLKGENIQILGYHRTLSAEALLSLQPDLIVGSDHTGPAATVNVIQQAQINFIQLDSPESVAELSRNIHQLAKSLNREATGQALIDDIQQLENAIVSKQNGSALNMVFLLDLNDRGLSQAGRDTVGNALITLLHGENVSNFNGFQTVSLESILAITPDVIIVGKRSNGAPEKEQLLARYPLLKNTAAGQAQRIVSVDASKLIAGLSITAVNQANQLAEIIFPSAR